MESRISRQAYIEDLNKRISRREFLQVGLLLTTGGAVALAGVGFYDLYTLDKQLRNIVDTVKPQDPADVLHAKQTATTARSRNKREYSPAATAEAIINKDSVDQEKMTQISQEIGFSERSEQATVRVSAIFPAILTGFGLKSIIQTKRRIQEVRDELVQEAGKVIGGRQSFSGYLTARDIEEKEKRIDPHANTYSSDND